MGQDFPRILQMSCDTLVKVKPEYYKGKIEKIQKYFNVDFLYNSAMSYKELGIPPVIVHGDLWTNNLLFEKDAKSGKIGDRLVSVIDWQQAHPGNLCEDIA